MGERGRAHLTRKLSLATRRDLILLRQSNWHVPISVTSHCWLWKVWRERCVPKADTACSFSSSTLQILLKNDPRASQREMRRPFDERALCSQTTLSVGTDESWCSIHWWASPICGEPTHRVLWRTAQRDIKGSLLRMRLSTNHTRWILSICLSSEFIILNPGCFQFIHSNSSTVDLCNTQKKKVEHLSFFLLSLREMAVLPLSGFGKKNNGKVLSERNHPCIFATKTAHESFCCLKDVFPRSYLHSIRLDYHSVITGAFASASIWQTSTLTRTVWVFSKEYAALLLGKSKKKKKEKKDETMVESVFMATTSLTSIPRRQGNK